MRGGKAGKRRPPRAREGSLGAASSAEASWPRSVSGYLQASPAPSAGFRRIFGRRQMGEAGLLFGILPRKPVSVATGQGAVARRRWPLSICGGSPRRKRGSRKNQLRAARDRAPGRCRHPGMCPELPASWFSSVAGVCLPGRGFAATPGETGARRGTARGSPFLSRWDVTPLRFAHPLALVSLGPCASVSPSMRSKAFASRKPAGVTWPVCGERRHQRFDCWSWARLEEVPLEVLRQRESKWLDMLNNWDKWMAKKHKKIRLRCQKGIPPSLRGRAWQYLSGSKVKLEQNIGKFDELDLLPGDPKWLDVIERDLHRQFPFHEMFVSRGGHGQQDLFRVLKAYTLYRPEEGYCQAQAPIAAVLLMHMPAEQAFWCLVQICEKYLPGYYSEKLEAIQLDGQILFSLLHKVSPVAYKHLSKQKIDPILYMTEWFMCAFSRTLPWSSVLRVWDMFFCEGVKIIFRVGLVLLKHTLGSSDKLKSCQGQYETMERLRALSPKIMQETFLVQEVIELPVTERQIEREHLIQLKKWRETHGELQCKSPPRLHGAKAISEAEPPTRKALEPVPSIIVPPGPAPVPKARKSKEKSREKGPTSPANGPGAEGNGAPGSARELLHPQVSPHHQSKESLSSRESEDTYL